MKTRFYLIAAILMGAAAWNSPARAEQSAGETSNAWQEAKSAFRPVNELRESSSDSAAKTEGTTVRVLGVDGSNLTVFPSVVSGASKASVTPTVQPQVVGVTVQPSAMQRESELVLLPSVDIALPEPAHLVSNQSNSHVSYATRAFAPADAQTSAQAPKEQFIPANVPPHWGPAVVPSGCCDSSCCDSCGGGCCGEGCCGCCCQPTIVVVGTEFVFLNPDVNGVPVGVQIDDITADTAFLLGPGVNDAAIDDFYAAPRIWIGIQGPCWGLVARYYHMRAAENAHDLFIPPPGVTGDLGLDVNNILEAYYTDLELTRNFCVHGCKNQFTFGARYAALEHNESIYVNQAVVNGVLTSSARRSRETFGTGLTASLNGRKPLFCNSCAHWFYNARGSILWGPSDYEATTSASVTATGGATASAASIDGAAVSIDEDLFIGELQAGLEWDFALRCLPAKAFFRVAFEYQYWDAASGLAAAGSFAGIDGAAQDYLVTGEADAPGLIVDFVGLTIGTGFTW